MMVILDLTMAVSETLVDLQTRILGPTTFTETIKRAINRTECDFFQILFRPEH